MLTYIILILYMFLIDYFVKEKKTKIICIFVAFGLLLSLRSIYIGLSDTSGVYLTWYNKLKDISIFKIYLINGINNNLFWYIFKLLITIFGYYRIVFSVLGFVFLFFAARHIYKYSCDVLLSSMAFLSMYYLFSYFLIRQCIAIAILFISYKYIKEKKFWKFLLLVLLAATIHKTALIFIIAYPFCNLVKFSKKNYYLILIAFVIAYFFPNLVYQVLSLIDPTYNKYISYGIYSVSSSFPFLGFLLRLSILIFSNLFCYEKDDHEVNIDMNLMTLGTAMFAFSGVIVEFYRVAIYFHIFEITRISQMSEKLRSKPKQILRYSILIAFVLYFLFVNSYNCGANPYLFFWE